ncbi:hypothetical protein VPNG_10303 [Cytospora leucostoma]|uniref:Uncharacterized protein n=1 Tax=Cytospora leucostoma TaxID=1230097 RepID=A0A423VB77_9PEZI|nr:hypothetical protein VPNG_10303 [Cytospora leucostoma]
MASHRESHIINNDNNESPPTPHDETEYATLRFQVRMMRRSRASSSIQNLAQRSSNTGDTDNITTYTSTQSTPSSPPLPTSPTSSRPFERVTQTIELCFHRIFIPRQDQPISLHFNDYDGPIVRYDVPPDLPPPDPPLTWVVEHYRPLNFPGPPSESSTSSQEHENEHETSYEDSEDNDQDYIHHPRRYRQALLAWVMASSSSRALTLTMVVIFTGCVILSLTFHRGPRLSLGDNIVWTTHEVAPISLLFDIEELMLGWMAIPAFLLGVPPAPQLSDLYDSVDALCDIAKRAIRFLERAGHDKGWYNRQEDDTDNPTASSFTYDAAALTHLCRAIRTAITDAQGSWGWVLGEAVYFMTGIPVSEVRELRTVFDRISASISLEEDDDDDSDPPSCPCSPSDPWFFDLSIGLCHNRTEVCTRRPVGSNPVGQRFFLEQHQCLRLEACVVQQQHLLSSLGQEGSTSTTVDLSPAISAVLDALERTIAAAFRVLVPKVKALRSTLLAKQESAIVSAITGIIAIDSRIEVIRRTVNQLHDPVAWWESLQGYDKRPKARRRKMPDPEIMVYMLANLERTIKNKQDWYKDWVEALTAANTRLRVREGHESKTGDEDDSR